MQTDATQPTIADNSAENTAQPVKMMEARFRSYCRGCNAGVEPGARIAFVAGVGSFCAACAAKGCKPCDAPRSVARYSRGARGLRAGITTTRFSSGATIYRNSRGRCEDAPCCGCCS